MQSTPSTPPPYNKDRKPVSYVVMTKIKFIVLMVGCMLMGAATAIGLGLSIIGKHYTSYVDGIFERHRAAYERYSNLRGHDDAVDDSTIGSEPVDDMPHYLADDEISFEMNAVTGFIRIPADMMWVRTLDFRSYNVPVEDGHMTVTADSYRWDIDIAGLRKECGSGARKLPVKVTISSTRSGNEKIYHLVSLLIQFRDDDRADLVASGYMFDK